MSNRNSPFSNQKSALEEYFNSLLFEDNNETEKPESATVTAKPDAVETHTSDPAPVPVQPPKIRTSPPSIADMLATVAEAVEEPPKSHLDFAEPVASIKLPLPEVAPVAEVKTRVVEPVKTDVKTEIQPAEKIAINVITTPVAKVAPVQQAKPAEPEVAITPEWAETPFQCLLFKVGGLSLAVPLVKLNGVIPWSENIVETPNQTEWYLGILMNHGHKVQVIDTAVMVLPPEHRNNLALKPEDRLSHILLVDDQKWGLACDSIGDVVWLQTNDVKWRSNKSKRPWLLGTAIDHMCAVMDTEAFASMLGSKS